MHTIFRPFQRSLIYKYSIKKFVFQMGLKSPDGLKASPSGGGNTLNTSKGVYEQGFEPDLSNPNSTVWPAVQPVGCFPLSPDSPGEGASGERYPGSFPN